MPRLRGILFDQDGVIIDTERDGHRVAFNRAFRELGFTANWSIETYGRLLSISGGKERMKHFHRTEGLGPTMAPGDEDAMIARIHQRKTSIFVEMLDAGLLSLRPGVRRIMEEINGLGLRLGVCTTSDVRAAGAVTATMLKGIRFDLVLAGDMVARKKPDPEIYARALSDWGLDPRECVVIEDSHNGIAAAKAAGIPVVATPSAYTEQEDLSEADILVTCLGDPDGVTGVLLRGSLGTTRDPFAGVVHARHLVEHFSP